MWRATAIAVVALTIGAAGLTGCEAEEPSWCGPEAAEVIAATDAGGYTQGCENAAGALHGPFASYDADGLLIAYGHYEDGEMSGTWRYYTVEGGELQLERLESYAAGDACGTWIQVEGEVTSEHTLQPCR